MKLNEINASVASQLEGQAKLGVRIEKQDQVPVAGPVDAGLWWRIDNVTAVFADLKRSTSISVNGSRQDAAYAYTYFIRAMTVILEDFGARYVDIQGDGIFGLFSGKNSVFSSAACAVTMRTQMEREVERRFKRDASTQQGLKVGIGVDRGTLQVRQLGLKGTRRNEVWAGNPVNMAAKLSSVARNNQIVVSERVYAGYLSAPKNRQRALLRSCGCAVGKQNMGLDLQERDAKDLWSKGPVPKNLGLDFQNAYRRKAMWCGEHGDAFCKAVLSGKK